MKRLLSVLLCTVVIFSWQPQIFAASSNKNLNLKSEAAVLLDSETNAVLYSKNADKKMYPASLTKIATAIYAIEKGNLDSIATISGNAVRQDGTRVYLVEGEKLPLKQLVQGMLINSGNDAAVAVAEQMDGSVSQFSEHINDYLRHTIGVQHTHFSNPSGLFAKNHYTTAMDMALITNYAMKNPIFMEIFGTKKIHWKAKAWDTNILTHHKMLKGEFPYRGITGGKTGYTTESKQTLSTSADNGKLKLTAVVLKSNQQRDKYDDTAKLFNYGFKSYQHTIVKQDEIFKKDKREFQPSSDILITEDVKGTVKEVSESGVLTIKNRQGITLQAVQLNENKPQPAPSTNKKVSEEKVQPQTAGVNIVIGLLVLLLVVFGFSTAKKIIGK
ncbi:D-alanyl-D-alanine carboxypeptidase family protein [Bacillus rubiinfantis]|uniref:D-alanyl-D-alanine carboxypeptidase family protein n=1 Tax=Bacillus rubiinfantis TaxID=1499680 RepID=UPI0005A99A1F|nr:D-alanyl-D-alanine carboxypeptidase family protein [Bacillus rubiinfantis]